MSAEDDAAEVLGQVQPIGDEHPAAQELAEAVARHAAERDAAARDSTEPTSELVAVGDAGGSVARPGDTLLVTAAPGTTWQQADELRSALRHRLPGLADVVVLAGVSAVAIYRGGTDDAE